MKIAFLTLGCKVNSYETEKMKTQFETEGYEIVSFSEKADVYVVNNVPLPILQTVNQEKCFIVPVA